MSTASYSLPIKPPTATSALGIPAPFDLTDEDGAHLDADLLHSDKELHPDEALYGACLQAIEKSWK